MPDFKGNGSRQAFVNFTPPLLVANGIRAVPAQRQNNQHIPNGALECMRIAELKRQIYGNEAARGIAAEAACKMLYAGQPQMAKRMLKYVGIKHKLEFFSEAVAAIKSLDFLGYFISAAGLVLIVGNVLSLAFKKPAFPNIAYLPVLACAGLASVLSSRVSGSFKKKVAGMHSQKKGLRMEYAEKLHGRNNYITGNQLFLLLSAAGASVLLASEKLLGNSFFVDGLVYYTMAMLGASLFFLPLIKKIERSNLTAQNA